MVDNWESDLEAGGWEKGRADADEEIAELKAELERMRAERAWQPIETAPKDAEILCYCDGRYLLLEWFGADWRDEVSGIWHPTHWQPLPELPEGE